MEAFLNSYSGQGPDSTFVPTMNAPRPKRPILKFIERQLYAEITWGWVVYRTVYTPESDTQWPIVIQKIREHVVKDIMDELFYEEVTDNTPNLKVIQQFRLIPVSDATAFNSATHDTIKTRFMEDFYLSNAHLDPLIASTVGEPLPALTPSILVVDAECLASIMTAPSPPDPTKDVHNAAKHYIKVLDSAWDEEGNKSRFHYRGLIRSQIDCLFELWTMVKDGDTDRCMGDFCDPQTGDFLFGDRRDCKYPDISARGALEIRDAASGTDEMMQYLISVSNAMKNAL
jgi:hypothetical protein